MSSNPKIYDGSSMSPQLPVLELLHHILIIIVLIMSSKIAQIVLYYCCICPVDYHTVFCFEMSSFGSIEILVFQSGIYTLKFTIGVQIIITQNERPMTTGEKFFYFHFH